MKPLCLPCCLHCFIQSRLLSHVFTTRWRVHPIALKMLFEFCVWQIKPYCRYDYNTIQYFVNMTYSQK